MTNLGRKFKGKKKTFKARVSSLKGELLNINNMLWVNIKCLTYKGRYVFKDSYPIRVVYVITKKL